MKIDFEGLNFQGYIGKVIVDEFNKCKNVLIMKIFSCTLMI
jgi:hypothetical protein